jgi:hypothetical protein
LDAALYTLTGTLGGVALGFMGQVVLARQRRSAEIEMAHDARLCERRNEIYAQVIAACLRQLELIQHAHPPDEAQTVSVEPPSDITIDESIKVQALVDTFGTRRVGLALKAFSDALGKFYAVVTAQQHIHLQATGASGIGPGESRALVESARQECRELYRGLVDAVRDETTVRALQK